jgi:peroxiredoxin
MKRRDLLLGAMATSVAKRLGAENPAEGHELIGRKAPPLELRHWLNCRSAHNGQQTPCALLKPLEMGDLRGKVVLLRWWTQGCPLCAATAPALRKLQAEYGGRGLQVVGIYHPKPPGDWDMKKVEQATEEKNFTFPIALDADWSALRRWWLTQDRSFTSVSFLVDRGGVIRYIHSGGEFHEGTHPVCAHDYHVIDKKIVELLAT